MLTLERFAHPRRRRRPLPAAVPAAGLALRGLPSHVLRPRIEDLGASWPAHACRCRQELPEQLAWAAPLLNPTRPQELLCSREQARDLVVWHHHLPTYEQVSFSCQRLARAPAAVGRRPPPAVNSRSRQQPGNLRSRPYTSQERSSSNATNRQRPAAR